MAGIGEGYFWRCAKRFSLSEILPTWRAELGNDREIMSQVCSVQILKYSSHSDYDSTVRYCVWSTVQAEGCLRVCDKNSNDQPHRLPVL